MAVRNHGRFGKLNSRQNISTHLFRIEIYILFSLCFQRTIIQNVVRCFLVFPFQLFRNQTFATIVLNVKRLYRGRTGAFKPFYDSCYSLFKFKFSFITNEMLLLYILQQSQNDANIHLKILRISYS